MRQAGDRVRARARVRGAEMIFRVLATLALCLAALGCKKAELVKLPGNDVVLVQVGSTNITKYDLELSARNMFSRDGADELDEAARKRFLESLVQARAIALKRESELTEQDKAELDMQLAAYREELLVKQYLTKHTKVQPVKPELVAKYYEQNQARFGAERVRSYELITSPRELSDKERVQLMAAMREPAARKDWDAWSGELQKQKLPVLYQRGTTQNGTLQQTLRNLVAQLAVGASSRLTFVDGRPYVVRVLEETATPAKPLAAVSAEIRKTLLPEQVKQSVQAASALVMKDTKVEYR
jgi:hypothetical protein